ncbi:unnamed protein product [Clavelina lepadiformis]|uniref:SMP-LTD domain-containing protein n=1 Tax=Clavelina lepadiformis TaxID=159417 RepID=A0ABP0FHW1_CLALP
MAVIAAILHRIGWLVPKNVLPEDSISIPLQVVVAVAAVLMVVYLYRQIRNENEKKNLLDPESGKVTVKHLTWANQLIVWWFVTSPQHLPQAVERWIQDLNIHLAQQQNKFGSLIFGLREGSSPPLIKEIAQLKRISNTIHARIMLESSDFGFMVTVEESKKNSTISSTYSAIVMQFHCWFSVKLSRNGHEVSLKFTPTEEKPMFRFNMKPLTKGTTVSVPPQAIADALQNAVLNTTFQFKFYMNNSTNPIANEGTCHEEESCYGDSDTESIYKDVKDPLPTPRVSRSLSDGHVVDEPETNRRQKQLDLLSNSDFCNSSKVLGGSLGSLSGLVRSPSGRGPAKPIRFREKRLQVKVIDIDGVKTTAERKLSVCFEIDLPHQRMDVSCNDKTTFDLSSRSSQLKITLASKSRAPSQERGVFVARASIMIDSIDMDHSTRPTVPLLNNDEKQIGSICLEFMIIENSSKRNSFSTPQRSHASAEVRKKFIETTKQTTEESKLLKPSVNETKVTMVKKVKGSPTRSQNRNGTEQQKPVVKIEDSQVTGVSYNTGSVVENAMKDLAKPNQNKPVGIKTKIMITAVGKNDASMEPPVEEIDQSQQNELSSASNCDSVADNTLFSTEEEQDEKVETFPPVSSSHVDTSESNSLSGEVRLRSATQKVKHGDARVRRTRSLIFGGGKKHKEHRNSLVMEGEADSLTTEILQVPQNSIRQKKKSPSMTKLFSKMTKSKKGKSKRSSPGNTGSHEGSSSKNENELAESSLELATPKMKRSRSFKDIIKGKKRTPKS